MSAGFMVLLPLGWLLYAYLSLCIHCSHSGLLPYCEKFCLECVLYIYICIYIYIYIYIYTLKNPGLLGPYSETWLSGSSISEFYDIFTDQGKQADKAKPDIKCWTTFIICLYQPSAVYWKCTWCNGISKTTQLLHCHWPQLYLINARPLVSSISFVGDWTRSLNICFTQLFLVTVSTSSLTPYFKWWVTGFAADFKCQLPTCK